jgi:hypothetical protein
MAFIDEKASLAGSPIQKLMLLSGLAYGLYKIFKSKKGKKAKK